MSFAAVGRASQRLLALDHSGPADTHHQGPVCMKGPADGQGVHVLREQGLVGKSVADASIIEDLRRGKGVSERGQGKLCSRWKEVKLWRASKCKEQPSEEKGENARQRRR